MNGKLVVKDDEIDALLSSLRRIKESFERDSGSADEIAHAVGHGGLADAVHRFSDSWRINRERLLQSVEGIHTGLTKTKEFLTTADQESARRMEQQDLHHSDVPVNRIAGSGQSDSGVSRVTPGAGDSTARVTGRGSDTPLDQVQGATGSGTTSVGATQQTADLDDLQPAAGLPSGLEQSRTVQQVLERVESLLTDIRDDVDALATPGGSALLGGVAGLGGLAAALSGRSASAGGPAGHGKTGGRLHGATQQAHGGEGPDPGVPTLDGQTSPVASAGLPLTATLNAGIPTTHVAGGASATTLSSPGFASVPDPGLSSNAATPYPIEDAQSPGSFDEAVVTGGAGAAAQPGEATADSSSQSERPQRRVGGMPMAAMGGMGGGSAAVSDRERAAAARRVLAELRAQREAGHVSTD